MRRWTGLSPRVRGNRNWRPLTMLTFWSIPARAGEPRRIAILKQLKGAYPRACGGTHFPALISAPQVGLSPRVRGNPERLNLVADDPRSIPARAGEPCSCSPSPRATSVYPRACGGTHILLHNVKLGKGLSPRVRGNRKPSSPLSRTRGSIPARAGEPFSILPSSGGTFKTERDGWVPRPAPLDGCSPAGPPRPHHPINGDGD